MNDRTCKAHLQRALTHIQWLFTVALPRGTLGLQWGEPRLGALAQADPVPMPAPLPPQAGAHRPDPMPFSL